MNNAGNVALKKRARLENTFGGEDFGRLASYAVDGDTSTSNLERCASGGDSPNNSWLQVDLEEEYVVVSIAMYVQG